MLWAVGLSSSISRVSAIDDFTICTDTRGVRSALMDMYENFVHSETTPQLTDAEAMPRIFRYSVQHSYEGCAFGANGYVREFCTH